MGDPLADLCALLRQIEDPDRFNRPRDHDVAVELERFEAMVRRLDKDFGPVTTSRAPDGEFPGLVSFGEPPLHLIVSKFGRFIASLEPAPPQPDDVTELSEWLDEGAWTIPKPIRDVLIWELGFGLTSSSSAVDPPAPGAETHKPLDARTPDRLREQVLALPTSPPELAVLRDALCQKLGIPWADGPSRSSEYPEHQLLVEAERLHAVIRADREGPDARRWLVIDDEIVTAMGSLSPLLQAIKHVFDVGIREAHGLLVERRPAVRHLRPYAGAFF